MHFAAAGKLVLGAILVSGLGLAHGREMKPDAAREESFSGRWEIQFKNPAGVQRPFVILELAQKDGEISGSVLSAAISSTKINSKSISLKAGELTFVLEVGQDQITFRGKRVGDFLEGRAEAPINNEWVASRTTRSQILSESEDQRALSAALRTEPGERRAALEKFLADFPNSPLREQAAFLIASSARAPEERQAALEKFLRDFPKSSIRDQAHFQIASATRDPEARLAAQEKFVAEFPKSSLRDSAYLQILNTYMMKRPPQEAKLVRIIDEYVNGIPETPLQIGPRIMDRRAIAYNNIADRLMVHEILLDKALELARKAVASVSEKTLAAAAAMYQTTLGQVYYKRKELALAEDSLKKAIAAPGTEHLGQAHLFLGRIYETKGEDDKALASYLNAAAGTGSTDLKAVLERAYLKKHGTLDGLHEKIDAVLLSRPKPFDPGRYEGKAGAVPERVVLVELFTGSECKPCIAADLAFDGLIERYDHNKVAVLQYHLHIPGPDPMTNPDTEQRARYYKVRGTPTALVDGTDTRSGGGLADGASRNFKMYTEKIEERFSRPASLKLSSLTLKENGDTLVVSGEVDAPSGGAGLKKSRLRIALAEEVVHYTGGNGIHFHRFVVRKMLGGPDGLPLENTPERTRFSQSVNLADLRANLQEDLDSYEKNRPGFQWSERQQQVNPKELAVVAFVQDDETKEILQSFVAK